MADLIDRDALLHDVSTECSNAHEAKYYEAQVALTRAKRIICDAPAVNRWIPCSERMPDDIKPVLITWANNSPVMSCHENDKGKPFTGAAHYCNGKWYWYSQFSEDILGEYGEYQDTVDVDVLAWMPMPEAYKSPEGGEHDA